MSHFDRKTLIFYGVAISSVVTLFSVVTRYGTTRLEAPVAIEGTYQLLVEPIAQCPEPPPLQLQIRQSGVFVNGALVVANAESDANPPAVSPFTLDGRWEIPTLTLAGKTPAITVCGQTVTAVAIASTRAGESFSGELTFAGLPEPLSFNSELLPPPAVTQPSFH